MSTLVVLKAHYVWSNEFISKLKSVFRVLPQASISYLLNIHVLIAVFLLTILSAQSSATVPSKEEIVRQLASFIDREMATWLEGKDLRELCGTNHKQLLELKVSELEHHVIDYPTVKYVSRLKIIATGTLLIG